MEASDQALPVDKKSTALVIVSVWRDNELPLFSQDVYEVEIAETLAVNSSVHRLVATDADLQVCLSI